MPTFEIAHVQQQGVDLIIVPLSREFSFKSEEEQFEAVDELQAAASEAGLAGTVVPVWEKSGRLAFIAPPNWHPFFKSISWAWINANLNRKLYW